VIPCNIHQFYKSVGDYERLVVLVLYVVNGKAVSDEDAFSGLSWRRAKVPGEPEWYVAQVQISSNCESSVVLAAQALADVLIGMLPDEKGVEQSSQNQADVLSKL
jgi:hypothetical protein